MCLYQLLQYFVRVLFRLTTESPYMGLLDAGEVGNVSRYLIRDRDRLFRTGQ